MRSSTIGHDGAGQAADQPAPSPRATPEGPAAPAGGSRRARLMAWCRRTGAWLAIIARRMRTPIGEIEPYEAGTTPLLRILARPAIIGFVGTVAITWGASLPSSPFTWKTCRRAADRSRVPSLVLRHPGRAGRERLAAPA